MFVVFVWGSVTPRLTKRKQEETYLQEEMSTNVSEYSSFNEALSRSVSQLTLPVDVATEEQVQPVDETDDLQEMSAPFSVPSPHSSVRPVKSPTPTAEGSVNGDANDDLPEDVKNSIVRDSLRKVRHQDICNVQLISQMEGPLAKLLSFWMVRNSVVNECLVLWRAEKGHMVEEYRQAVSDVSKWILLSGRIQAPLARRQRFVIPIAAINTFLLTIRVQEAYHGRVVFDVTLPYERIPGAAPVIPMVRPSVAPSTPVPVNGTIVAEKIGLPVVGESPSVQSLGCQGNNGAQEHRGERRMAPRKVEPVLDDDNLFNWFTVRERRVHSPERSDKRLPGDYQKGKGETTWKSTGKPFELWCQDVWGEAQSFDRGMRTFLDMVLARVPTAIATKLAPLCKMIGPYRDGRSQFSVADLGRITPVDWIRLAAPIAEFAGVSGVRLVEAQEVRQEPDESFKDFFLVLHTVYLVAGIHQGWTIPMLKGELLKRFPAVLNEKCTKSYRKEFQSTFPPVEDYDYVIGVLERADGWRVTASGSARNWFRNTMQANLIEAAKTKPVETEGAVKRKGVNEQAGPSKNANVRKENRRLQARICELEQKKVPETSAAAPATMAIANACPHCNTSHSWTPETCKRNPAYKAEWEKKRKEYATQQREASKKTKRPATNDSKITEIKE